MEPHPPADWFEFWVRFVFGALLGLIAGVNAFDLSSVKWWELALCGLVVGLIAGWFGDRFWSAFARWFWL